MIDGVYFKELITHTDERGYFREIIRSTDEFFSTGFGQLSHSLVYSGVIKAWHAHKYQTQWNYIISGLLRVVLFDQRPNSSTVGNSIEFLVGDYQPVRAYCFPPAVLHGYRCISGPAHVIYVTSGIYDLSDEIRIQNDDPSIGYDWLREQEIK